MVSTAKRTLVSNEIVDFLDALHRVSGDLPKAIDGQWHEAVNFYKRAELDRVMDFCSRIETVLKKLRDGDGDLRLINRALAQNSILFGASYLDKGDYHAANFYFRQGVRHSYHWGHAAFESLAHFAQSVTYHEDSKWSQGLESAQKALNAVEKLTVPDKSSTTINLLTERIRREIELITAATLASTTADIGGKEAKFVQGVPIINNILSDDITAKENIRDYLYLDEDYHNGADFAVVMADDPIEELAIRPGDILLFRQEPDIPVGNVASVVIRTPLQTVKVIKRYYYSQSKGKAETDHWFLTSGRPDGPHIVVIPSTAKTEEIEKYYANAVRSGALRNYPKYYENGQVTVVGKYVGLVRKM